MMDGPDEEYTRVVARLGVLQRLSQFEPMLIGTPPLGLAVPGSDIDVACFSATLEGFLSAATAEFGTEQGFMARIIEWVEPPAAIVVFQSAAWTVELFCQTVRTRQQVGVRHFLVEQRLLAMEPKLGPHVLSLKKAGLKTEEAFARSLRLAGPDPYRAILELEELDDEKLGRLVRERFDAR